MNGINLTSDITVYVAKTGSDSTGTGTSGKPFLTIQKAIDKAREYYNPSYTIHISIGDGIYTEAIRIRGFYTPLIIESVSADESKVVISAENRVISGYYCSDVMLSRITIKQTGTPVGGSEQCIYAVGIGMFQVANCKIERDTTNTSVSGVFITTGTTAYIADVVFNKIGRCVSASRSSNKLHAINLSGADNYIGYQSIGSVVIRSGTTPTVGTMEEKTSGGQIFS